MSSGKLYNFWCKVYFEIWICKVKDVFFPHFVKSKTEFLVDFTALQVTCKCNRIFTMFIDKQTKTLSLKFSETFQHLNNPNNEPEVNVAAKQTEKHRLKKRLHSAPLILTGMTGSITVNWFELWFTHLSTGSCVSHFLPVFVWFVFVVVDEIKTGKCRNLKTHWSTQQSKTKDKLWWTFVVKILRNFPNTVTQCVWAVTHSVNCFVSVRLRQHWKTWVQEMGRSKHGRQIKQEDGGKSENNEQWNLHTALNATQTWKRPQPTSTTKTCIMVFTPGKITWNISDRSQFMSKNFPSRKHPEKYV